MIGANSLRIAEVADFQHKTSMEKVALSFALYCKRACIKLLKVFLFDLMKQARTGDFSKKILEIHYACFCRMFEGSPFDRILTAKRAGSNTRLL